MDRGDHSGPDYKDFNIARLERYVDEDGVVQSAICYKKEGSDMNIWFRYEEVKSAYENGKSLSPHFIITPKDGQTN